MEHPIGWSDTAIKIFVDKYLHAKDGGSTHNAIRRVAKFVSRGNERLEEMLIDGLTAQRFSFNSPVWFNAGIEPNPQLHACFIQSVTDDMDSILDLAVKEGQLFKHGSGTGTNLSQVRGSQEQLSNGGKASGPVSFMKMYDAVAGIVKSGGKTRRAAKMQILNVDHPDILAFINAKAGEEAKARDLIEKAGYDSSFNGKAYDSIFFQNANLSVRVTDEFMQAVRDDEPWSLTARTTGDVLQMLPARQIWRAISQAAWQCGDPGVQFHDTINGWHTCPKDGPIVASNPCSEYMFLEETACNLASLNLVKYVQEDSSFNVELFEQDIYALVRAMDNIIGLAGYPTDEIRNESLRYRTLGLGYTNLGGALIKLGLRYDSEAARDWAASVTAMMHFTAMAESVRLAQERDAYPAYDVVDHWRIFKKHVQHISRSGAGLIWECARAQVEYVLVNMPKHGIRNAQVTCIAPAGTISFIMDCLTTGIEPLFSRTWRKELAGGGFLEGGHDGPAVVTASEISPDDHIAMMAAVQPFLSGAISKTVNLPNSASVEEIERVYMLAYDRGLKSIAVYRDGCKLSQPMTSTTTEERQQHPRRERQPLPSTRKAITHRFSVAGHDGYVTVGMYENGRPGEVFVHMAKEGSTISGLLDCWAISLSISLQYGVPLDKLLDKLTYTRFEPAGLTGNPSIPMAHSVIDYIARWLLLNFCRDMDEEPRVERPDERACPDCGGMLQRTGSCYSCATCGFNGGCG